MNGSEELNLEHLQSWTERPPVVERQVIQSPPLRTLAAILERSIEFVAGAEVPPLWHWVSFAPIPRASEIGDDGHQRRGGFLPPVPFRRRMWAASEIEFNGALRVGQSVEKASHITDVRLKQGASGPLVFVAVECCYRVEDVVHILEKQTLVYTAGKNQVSKDQARKDREATPEFGIWSRNIRSDPVLLFRYSAVTSNTHRIHYDRDYALREEGYTGLVVHAPLTATLMLELLNEKCVGERVAEFRFRALQPLLDTDDFTIHGRRQNDQATLWAVGPSGQTAVRAEATLDASPTAQLENKV